MRSMHIIFPKGQTIEGKEERGEEAPTTATQHRTHSCTPTHSRSHGHGHSAARAAVQVTKNVQNRTAARSPADDDTSATGGSGRGRSVVQRVPSQGFFDVADADGREGRTEGAFSGTT